MPAQADHAYGPYRVIRPLGGGGMGTVLLAEDPRLSRLVALKTVAGHAATSAAARQRLLHEARAAARLSHPNIAAVHDVLDIAGELVIVFEYVEGETLASRLSRGRLTVPEALRIGEQLADGLAAAHAQGVIHRDLKPGNVMLTPDGRAKILDFGIAQSRSFDSEETNASLPTGVGLYAGTPAYAAPEQWLGEPLGEHTDIFALGLVLFEMLGGRRPFEGHSRLTLMQQMIEAPRPHLRELNPHVPPSIDALVDSAISREPSRRPATAREIAGLLRSLGRDVGEAHQPRRASAPVRRRAALVGLLFLIVVGALVATLRGGRLPSPGGPAPVVAVLPLTNATGSDGNDYLAAGLAESLTTSLASLSGITVLSRAAVMGVWDRGTTPSKVAKDLGASYLVEGSVQQAADKIRLSINLVRPDQTVVWADSVDGTRDRVFDLQSRLAIALGRALSLQVSSAVRAELARQPTADPDALAAYWRGRTLLERRDVKGNLDAALSEFDTAVGIDPKFGIAHAARGEALWSRYLDTRSTDDARAAVAAGLTGLRLSPERPEVRYALAITLAGTGQLDAAVDELQNALAVRPTFDDARVQLGRTLARQRKIDEAIAEFRKVTDRRPTYAAPYTAMGLSLLEAGRYRAAAEAFEHVTSLQPDNVLAYQQAGAAYQLLGDDSRALAFYQKALAIRPYAPAYSNIGAIHHKRGEYEQAIAAYLQAIEIRPNARETYRNLGDAYARLGRQAEARAAYQRAIELTRKDVGVNPQDARVHAALALYLQKAGRAAEAAASLSEALRLSPNDFEVLRRAAAVHALAGRADAALDALDAAIRNGFDKGAARTEDELRSLQSLPRFKTLTGD